MKKLIFFSFLIAQLALSQEKGNDFYDFNLLRDDSNYKTTLRYENILNFSKPTYKLNLYSAYADLRQYDKYSKLYLNLGRGYICLSDTWDFNYSVEKNFVAYQEKDEGDTDSDGWELEFSLVNYLKNFNWAGHRWSQSWGIGSRYSDGGDLEYDLFDEKVTDIFLTYRISTNFDNIGLGGSYLGISTNGGGVLSSVKDNGYRFSLLVDSFTNWGYGFQTANVLTNELRDYGNYNNTYMLAFASTTSWTYELSHDFAFITDVFFESENFFNGTDRADKIEFNIFPHLGYNKKLDDSFRFFAKLGVTPISIIEYSDSYSDNGFYARGVAGITYRW